MGREDRCEVGCDQLLVFGRGIGSNAGVVARLLAELLSGRHPQQIVGVTNKIVDHQ